MEKFFYDIANGEPIFSCEYGTFDIYFSSLVSINEHPGAGTKEHQKMTLEECRDKAIAMLKIRRALPMFDTVPDPTTVKVVSIRKNESGVDNG